MPPWLGADLSEGLPSLAQNYCQSNLFCNTISQRPSPLKLVGRRIVA